MSRPRRVLAVCALVAALGGGLRGQSVDEDPFWDFPESDYGLRASLSVGIQVKRGRELLTTQPSAPATIRLLLAAKQIDEALDAVHRAAERPDAGFIPVLEALAEQTREIAFDETHGYPAKLRSILAPTRISMASLPRDAAARAAKALAVIDSYLDRGGSQGWQQRMRTFVDAYAGTEIADVTAADLISSGNEPIMDRIAKLEEYWKAHPNSAAGGRALWQKGFQLHVNVPITGIEPRGSDPTNRLLEVAAIVKELESGRYPPGQWVTEAPSLISGFFVSSSPPPVYAPGNVERSLETYREFVLSHFDQDPKKGVGNSVGYVITSKMAGLYKRVGNEQAGIEELLRELEARSSSPATVRLFRAQYYLQGHPAQGAERVGLVRRAKELLTDVANERAGRVSQQALAALASFEFDVRDPDASAHLQWYADRYPKSEWAWVARIRLGELLEERGDLAVAEAAYVKAVNGTAQAFAKVVGLTGAARVREGLGRFQDAADAYRQSLAFWDTDYGIEYRWDTRAPALPDGSRPMARQGITRESLTERATSLERALAGDGGAGLARAAWLHREKRLAEARTSAETFVKVHPESTVAPDGVRLLHEIKFDQALDLAALTNASRDESAALALLDSFVNASIDAGVFAGRVAKSALLFRQGRQDAAGDLMRKTLRDLIAAQRPQQEARLSGVEADVAAIRTVVFRPLGDLAVYRGQSWNAFTFPTALPEFVVLNPAVTVKVSGSGSSVRTIRHGLPDLPQAVYLDRDDLARVARIIVALGGTERREPTQIMETPNQPVGMSRNLVAFLATIFPSRAGHWGGWELETYPQVRHITFLDEARTRATAAVTIGYSGGVVVLEKVAGRWVALRWTGSWIT